MPVSLACQRSRNISRKCSGYNTQIKAACATSIKIQPAEGKCTGELVVTRLLSLLFTCFAKSFAGCRVTIKTALKTEQWFVENFCLGRG